MKKKIIIIGLGNEYISDDGVGVKVVRQLQKQIKDNGEITDWFDIKFEELAIGGLGIIDVISGYDICIIIDAIYTRKKKVGTIYRFVQRTDKEIKEVKSSHQISLSQVLTLAQILNIKIPELVVVYGIEVKDVTTFNEACTPEVERKIKNLALLVYNDFVNFNIQYISCQPIDIYFEEELM